MKHKPSDPSADASVAEAREAYREVLTRRGLLNFTRQEVADARASLISQGQARIAPEDIKFQAAVARLGARKDMLPQTIDEAIRELLDAEYECDQSKWERDCQRTVMMDQMNTRLPFAKPPLPKVKSPSA